MADNKNNKDKDKDAMASFDGLDIRPLSVDRLVQDTEHNITDRRDRLLQWRDRGVRIVETAQAHLEKSKDVFEFVERELEGAELAIKLKRDDIVRVECPACKGTGLRPEDVTSGQYKQPSTAFSTTTSTPRTQQKPTRPTEKQRCQTCEGKRWIIMTRFKG